MERKDLDKFNIPDLPGVYIFRKGRKVLYVGKATSLSDRVRSYFDDDLIDTRGPRLVDVVTSADRVSYETTPTVLEALVREAALIRSYEPPGNAMGMDDRSFLYAVITREDIPRVLAYRVTELDEANGIRGPQKKLAARKWLRTPGGARIKSAFGPFPSGAQLREGLRIIQKIFPFFDSPKPVGEGGLHNKARIEFNRQIGQYPYVKDVRRPDSKSGRLTSRHGREIDIKEYRRTIRRVALLLSGRGKELRLTLEREMRKAAKEERFEAAVARRRELFALDHLQDVALIKDENGHKLPAGSLAYRIEGYDSAHISGTNAIGVMTVVDNGRPVKSEYRTFRIRGVKKADDIASLKEVLSRRFNHPEWIFPKAIIVDGGRAHKKAAETVLKERNFGIPVVAVVKDERHRPREVLGAVRAGISEADAVLANAEAHRFSLSRHRRARSRNFRN